MFANDSVLIRRGDTPKEASDGLAADIRRVIKYFNKQKLLLNSKKTKIVHFDRLLSGKNLCKFEKINIDGEEIEVVDKFKYLGFLIDNKLNFSSQASSCIKQANYKMFLMRKIRGYMNSKTSLLIYKSMVLPYLEYGINFLMSCTKTVRLKFQRLQNKCLKIALNRCNLYNTRILHKEARMADWEHRARLASCRLMFKHKYCQEYTDNVDLGTRSRGGPLFKQDQPSNVGYLKSHSYLCRKEWNSLPVELRCIDDLSVFKTRVKKYYLDIYFNPLQI